MEELDRKEETGTETDSEESRKEPAEPKMKEPAGPVKFPADHAAAPAAEGSVICSEKREKKHTWKFFAGILAGLLLAVLILVLRKGYFVIPLPLIGEVTVKLPTYGMFVSEEGGINEAELKRKLQEIDYYMRNEYYYDQNTEDLEDAVVRGVYYNFTSEDGYSAYYSQKEYMDEMEGWNGSFVGIGVYVIEDEATGGVKVVQPIKGGPAMEAGIQTNDIIVEADGVSLLGMDLETATGDYIKGKEGTSVKLVILRNGERIEKTVPRRKVTTETVYSSMIEKDGRKYGYIYVSSFLGTTYDAFTEAVDRLCGEEACGIVIDLRNDTGGDMNVCLNMADYLLPDDIGIYSQNEVYASDRGRTKLLTVRMKKGQEDCYYAQDGHTVKIPVTVLVDGNSASASEIFAGIMKSYGRKVAGTVTYGKGIVQTVRMLYDMSGIKYTSGEYIIPDGERIHGKGLEPDVTAEPSEWLKENGADPDHPDPENDNMLGEAIRLLGE